MRTSRGDGVLLALRPPSLRRESLVVTTASLGCTHAYCKNLSVDPFSLKGAEAAPVAASLRLSVWRATKWGGGRGYRQATRGGFLRCM